MQLKGYKKRQTDLDDTLQLIKPSVLITNLLHNVLKFSGDLRCSSLLGVIRVNTRSLYERFHFSNEHFAKLQQSLT